MWKNKNVGNIKLKKEKNSSSFEIMLRLKKNPYVMKCFFYNLNVTELRIVSMKTN